MYRTLYLDLETYSETPIKHGVYRYAEKAEIMLWAYAFDDGPVSVWDLTQNPEMPEDLYEGLYDDSKLVGAHNSGFDRTIIGFCLDYWIPLYRVRDTMIQALAHSLPGALQTLCAVMGVDEADAKDKRGKDLVRFFCMPRPVSSKIRRATRETNPVEWQEFINYAGSDIRAMRSIAAKMPAWNCQGEELLLWQLDQEINRRGFLVDVDLATKAIAAVDKEQKRLGKEVNWRTGGAIDRATQRDKMLKFILEEYGVDLPDMQKSTIERRLQDENLPPEVKNLLAIRQEAAMSSTSKYAALVRSVSSDGRLRGTSQFCGASRTGRSAGRLFQPENLFRATLPPQEVDNGIAALKSGHADLLIDNVMEVAANAMRGCIIAPKAKKLVIADLSNIEGRFAAWIADEQWKLDAFRKYDAGEGPDLYKLAYARAFNITPDIVTKDQRQIGKVLELACIAEGQMVLTDKGLIPIEKVRTFHRVWDGTSFVKHDGVVYRGIKEVIRYEGLEATEDHVVWTKKGRNLPFGECARKQIPLYKPKHGRENTRKLENTFQSIFLERGIRQTRTQITLSVCKGALFALSGNIRSELRQFISRKNNFLSVMCAPSSGTEMVISAHGCGETKMSEQKRSGVQKLWRSQREIPFQIPFNSGGLDSREFRTSAGYGDRSHKQQRTLRTGKSSLGYQIIEFIQQQARIRRSCASNMGARRKSFKSIYNRQILKTWFFTGRYSAGGDKSGPRKKEKLARYKKEIRISRVYDILNSGPNNRFTVSGVLVHNCGYSGGVGAFIAMSSSYDMDLDAMAAAVIPTVPSRILQESTNFYEWCLKQRRSVFGLNRDTFISCDSLKRMWREANPKIVMMWDELQNVFINCINYNNQSFQAGRVTLRRDGAWLRMILPSGRSLCYPSPRINDNRELSYMGINNYSRKWERIKTFSGKLFENLVQAGARDVFASSWIPAERAGYETILRVHDELVTEVPDLPYYNAENLARIMATNPPWAQGLPLAAAGFETYRYRK